jgi:DNA gyrase subunit A
MRLKEQQKVIALIPIMGDGTVILATANGYGKRTKFDDFPLKGRGGQGVIAIQANERNGEVIGASAASDGQDIMLITGQGVLVRTAVSEVSVIGRNTQGLRLIALGKDENLVGVEIIPEIAEEEPTE